MPPFACLAVAAITLAAVPSALFGRTRGARILGYVAAMGIAAAPASLAPSLATSVEAALGLTVAGALLGATLAIWVSRVVLVARFAPAG